MFLDAELEKVPTSIVHKEFEDDVLVANMRGLLPSWIPVSFLDSGSELGGNERELLRRAYAVERRLPDGSAPVLGLSCLPHSLDAETVSALPPETQELVQHHYRLDGNWWLLFAQFMDENDQLSLSARLSLRHTFLADQDRYQLSKIMDKLPCVGRPAVSCFDMVLDTNNYFFYRKHHEHVPGIMLIEVVRQAMYAQYYKHSGVGRGRGQVSLTIEALNVNFMNFVNANYPVRIQVWDERSPEIITADAPMEERVARFHQLGRTALEARMRANPIKMNLFKRLRNVRPPPQARFLPMKNIAPVAAFIRPNGEVTEGRIQNLSIQGLCARFFHGTGFPLGEKCTFSVFVTGFGLINGIAEIRWSALTPDGESRVGFCITETNVTSSTRLRETIKNFTFVDLRRGEL